MPWPEFKARENLAALRSGLAYAGAMRRLNPTGVSMNLTNRLRVEFGFDADGMIGANDISAATDLLINLHMWANSLAPAGNIAGLREDMRRVVGGSHPFPSKGTKRGPRNRPNRATCWWEEEPYGRS
ncbi:hypothetical protein SNK04_014049 [Fusarium graminearum]